MSTIDGQPSDNGRGPKAWSSSWTHFRIERPSAAYCRVTFDHPPINTVSTTTVVELAELVGLIEEDSDLNVVVYDSANPDFYLDHCDAENSSTRSGGMSPSEPGLPEWPGLLVRLSRAPVVSIASIRGRARGVGTDFVLACDLRFASRENTSLGQFGVGTTAYGGSGGIGWLPRLVGRSRAAEILFVAGDLDGPQAERYGCINRLIFDDRLDDAVNQIATRLARLDRATVSQLKASLERVPPRPPEPHLSNDRERLRNDEDNPQ